MYAIRSYYGEVVLASDELLQLARFIANAVLLDRHLHSPARDDGVGGAFEELSAHPGDELGALPPPGRIAVADMGNLGRCEA